MARSALFLYFPSPWVSRIWSGDKCIKGKRTLWPHTEEMGREPRPGAPMPSASFSEHSRLISADTARTMEVDPLGKRAAANCKPNAPQGPFLDTLSPALLSLIPGSSRLPPSQTRYGSTPPSRWLVLVTGQSLLPD